MAEEQQQRAEGVSRMLSGEQAPEDTNRESQVGPTGGQPGQMSPEVRTAPSESVAESSGGVGDSMTRHGEDVIKEEGPEAGRIDEGTQGPTNRPVGSNTGRFSTGVDPQDSQTGGPNLPGAGTAAGV